MLITETKRRVFDAQFVQQGNSLAIRFKDYLFIEHTMESPFLYVGKGKAHYQMLEEANFIIEENLYEKFALNQFEVVENTEDHLKVKFSKVDVASVTVDFKMVNGRLEAAFEEYSPELNRVWIRFKANPQEGVFGCGEQYSELNLRGKNVPLWVTEQGVGRNKKEYVTFMADKYRQAGGDWYTTYYPQPTFVSSENYWCHVDDSNYMEFNFRNDNYHELYIRNIPAKVILSKKDSALEVLEDLTAYLGRQPEMPEWIYNGVVLGLQGGTEKVLGKLAKINKGKIT